MVKKRASRAGTRAQSAEAADTEHTALWARPGFLVRRLHQIHVAMFLAEMGGEVTPIQYGLVSVLANMPGVDQFTLGEELGLDRANIADLLKRLEAAGLVTRAVDPENRRRKLCRATAKGLAFVRRHGPGMRAVQERLIEPLAAAERAKFMALLRKLVDANNEYGRTVLRPDADRGRRGGR